MMLVPAEIKVHMAVGYTDLRKGLDGLAVLAEQVLERDTFSGYMFVFRGKRADMIKVLFREGSGLCLLTKRLEEGRCFDRNFQRTLVVQNRSGARYGQRYPSALATHSAGLIARDNCDFKPRQFSPRSQLRR
jgi:hypothetical protein